ncbi:hypothetical protein KCU70_g445, partial [Aureobasidium melanogenum]
MFKTPSFFMVLVHEKAVRRLVVCGAFILCDDVQKTCGLTIARVEPLCFAMMLACPISPPYETYRLTPVWCAQVWPSVMIHSRSNQHSLTRLSTSPPGRLGRIARLLAESEVSGTSPALSLGKNMIFDASSRPPPFWSLNQLTMVRRRYTYDVQRAQSSDSEEMEEHIFVGGKPSKGIRKRVGDIRFWLEDREKRRTKGEHGETSAFTTSAHHENSAPVRATTTPRPKRNTTTPRRILSHIESKLSCINATAETHSLVPSPIMANKRKNTDAAYAARPPRKKTPPSTQAKSFACPEEPPLATRRPTRATERPNYSDHTAYLDIEDSDEEPEQKPVENSSAEEDSYTNSEDGQSASSTMSSNQSLSSGEPASESGSVDGPMRKRAKANNGRPHKPVKSTPESVPESAAKEVEVADSSSKQQSKSRPKKTKVNMKNLNLGMKKDVNRTLPPLSDITSIFDHMVGKGFQTLQSAHKYNLEDVCKHVGSRPLKVATMCSGTESPLLAWDMISDCIQKREGGLELKYEHVFSAEIVPFKQAYIERNFRPPIIFRDITEITNNRKGMATTAYGGRAKIPGDVDMVIAGTACVDFSNLNNNKKTLEERGESGDTFAAVLAYAKEYRPTMLVLENVYGAPWDKMLAEYEEYDYVSAGVLVDSKNYYLPQTRQRGYMVCVDKNKLEACNIDPADFKESFYERMADFKRPVSSPFSSFILPNDDPLVTRASQSMARQSLLDASLREVDWARCEIRHINYRREKELGISRPVTNWQESGTLVLPENCNRLWFGKQVERVWDFVDMSQLRKANNVLGKEDRKTRITPDPLPGYDAQYKTRIWDVSQNIDRFTDGAPFGIAPCLTPSGNFYITDRGGPLTFTESLMLQGLPLDRVSFTTETDRNIQDLAGNAMSTTVRRLVIRPSLEKLLSKAPSPLLADASKSAAMCVCEGQIGLSEAPIQICKECGHSSCLTCGVKPSHDYGEPCQIERGRPEAFIQKWRSRIPMVLKFNSTDDLMDLITSHLNVPEPRSKSRSTKSEDDPNKKYTSAIREALTHTLTFKTFRRTSSWIIIYESSFARLELVLGAQSCEWKLYAKPGDELSGEDEIRKFFGEPVGIAQVTEGAFFGSEWKWRIFKGATTPTGQLQIAGQGEQVPSWAARLGLPRHAKERVWSELNIELNGNCVLPAGVQGTYKLLRDCGTACESLYKRTEPIEGSDMFLFLDPTRIGKPEDDRFVFARDHSRLQYDQVREITATIDATWRPETQTNALSCTSVTLNGHWVDGTLISGHRLCATKVNTVLDPTTKPSLPLLDGPWSLFARIWKSQSCAPPVPEVRFRLVAKPTMTEFHPYEDSESATNYEVAIKSRPQPFIIECDISNNSAVLNIGLNATTMCHRAARKLKMLTGSVGPVSWKLDTAWVDEAPAKFPPFTLRNNSDNVAFNAHGEILNGIELYDIQKRSLTWMKEQEEGNGRSFEVKETEEALLTHLGWRLESTASTKVHIKGGILADHAGFGKTITSLALIQSEFEEKTRDSILEDMHGNRAVAEPQLIPIAATLIICPHAIVEQWEFEVKKLIPMKHKSEVVAIKTIGELVKQTRECFEQAKIIIMSKRVLELNSDYLKQLAMFTAMPKYTGKSNRALQLYLRDATSRIPEHLRILGVGDHQGASKLQEHLTKLYEETLNDPKYLEYAQESKRLKGKAYAKRKKDDSAASGLAKENIDEARKYKIDDEYMLLEMFQFNRLVVDEFSYTEPHDLMMYCNINASKRWALSATPRLKDTYDVSRMALFLGLSLPIGASAPGLLSSANMSALRKDLTNVEQFETFREMPSHTTQESIHGLAQEFLNTFLRQNLMRHDQFPYEDQIVPITLYADHRLVYTNLSQKFNSQDMRIRKGRSKAVDLSTMPKVNTAEEALLCTAAVYAPLRELPQGTTQDDIRSGLEALVQRCENDCSTARESLREKMKVCIRGSGKSKLFSNWVDDVNATNAFGDKAVAEEIMKLARELPAVLAAETAAQKAESKSKKRKLAEVTEDTEEFDPGEESDRPDQPPTAEEDDFKEQGTTTGNIKDDISKAVSDAKAYASSTRALRFVNNALKHESRHQDLSNKLACDVKNCKNTIDDPCDLHVSANCGHTLCPDCIEASKNLLGICPVDGCEKDVKSYHLLDLGKLGESITSDYGSKADGLIELLEKIAAQRQQAILFVQFAHQIEDMTEILAASKISYHNPRGIKDDPFGAFTGNYGIDKGKQDHKKDKKLPTVLILNSNDESAAGANLTCANHVIFYSPLLKRTQYEYEAQMAQAIGRVRRPGQIERVQVYRFVALDTIDVDILEHREHRTTVMAEYQHSNLEKKLVPGTNFKPKDGQELVKPQKTQLIRDVNGEYKLVPRQLLLAAGGEGVFAGNDRVLGYEKFNSLIKFSSGFIQDD